MWKEIQLTPITPEEAKMTLGELAKHGSSRKLDVTNLNTSGMSGWKVVERYGDHLLLMQEFYIEDLG